MTAREERREISTDFVHNAADKQSDKIGRQGRSKKRSDATDEAAQPRL
jgi:hypothetical protein